MLTLQAPNPQNSQTHPNIELNCLNVFDHFAGLELTGLQFTLNIPIAATVASLFYLYG